ncbi:MAG: metal ABC transporter permease [Desulfurococcales archaeon]|nr:metal ABC transporter permease [Desulfurococcales archaeon]
MRSSLSYRIAIFITVISVILSIAYIIGNSYPIEWFFTIVMSSTAMGSLSILIYTRRLRYLAASSPHAAFLAAGLGIVASVSIGGNWFLWTIIIGMVLVYVAGYMIYKGVDPEDSASIFVAFSSSMGALVLYYVLTRYSYGVSVVSIVIGDPLLSSLEIVAYSIVIGLLSVIYVYSVGREIIYIGSDIDDARLAGLKIWLYDWSLYTMIGLTTIGLVKSVGFVLEHVYLLLPGAIAAMMCRGVARSITFSILVSILSASIGLLISISLDLAPSAVSGGILIILFVISAIMKGR